MANRTRNAKNDQTSNKAGSQTLNRNQNTTSSSGEESGGRSSGADLDSAEELMQRPSEKSESSSRGGGREGVNNRQNSDGRDAKNFNAEMDADADSDIVSRRQELRESENVTGPGETSRGANDRNDGDV